MGCQLQYQFNEDYNNKKMFVLSFHNLSKLISIWPVLSCLKKVNNLTSVAFHNLLNVVSLRYTFLYYQTITKSVHTKIPTTLFKFALKYHGLVVWNEIPTALLTVYLPCIYLRRG